MEQRRLDNDSRNRGKRETIGQGKSCGEEQRRVRLVGIQIECKIWRQNIADIVKIASIVVRLRIAYGEVISIPSTRVMDTNCSDPPEYDYTNHGIGYCVPGRDKRTIGVCGDLSPIKGDWQQRDPSPSAKELVYHNVVGAYPDSECEDAEERRNEARKPVPAEGTNEDEKEILVSRDAPAVALCRVGL